MILGVTGSIGSGKTTVAKLFSRHWCSMIDADEIGHKILENPLIYDKLRGFFGDGILAKNKSIDRKQLGNIIFDDAKKLKKLNSITHPIILKEIKNEITKIKNACPDKIRIVIDAPLLLETKAKELADKIIVVKCNKENVLKRLNKKYPKEKIERILNAQMPLSEKIKHADFVIDNNKGIAYLKKQVTEIVGKIQR